MGFFLGLGSNIAANLIFWALLGSVFWALSLGVARRFSRFFGLVRVDSMGIYLSNLWTPQTSLLGGKREGYTISLHELRAAQSVDKLFGSAPLRLPDLVRGLVDALWLRRQVRCVTDVSPLKAEDADLERNLIIVGSSVRNSVRARYVRARLPTAILTGEDQELDARHTMENARSITIIRGETRSEVSLADVNVAVVEKCRDPDRGTALFFCLGIRGDGSWAATEFLVRNWKDLSAEFGDDDFVVCLGFPRTEKYLDEYKDPLRLSVGSSR
jgi:hypothetical protein